MENNNLTNDENKIVKGEIERNPNRPYIFIGRDGNEYHLKNNYTNKKFGHATPIQIDHKDKERNKIYWVCRCDCGTEFITDSLNFITKKDTLNCGCQNKNNLLIGKKFGKLTIENVNPFKDDDKYKSVRCKCDCGNHVDVFLYQLYKGYITNCGCEKKEDKGAEKYIGKRYNNLVVEKFLGSFNNRRTFRCKCDCGGIIDANSDQLARGYIQDCGCGLSSHKTKKKFDLNNYIGKKFGYLTITGGGYMKAGRRYLIADCDCGTKNVEVRVDSLENEITTHCKNCTGGKIIKVDYSHPQLLTIDNEFIKDNRTYYSCTCKCGTTNVIVRSDLYKSRASWHCGCQKISVAKYIGARFGRLVVKSIYNVTDSGETIYECDCDCGNTCRVTQTSLNTGKTKSCGCLRRETAAEIGYNHKIHGDKGTKLYNTWGALKSRCNNPDDQNYKNYGGRGITVCPEWDSPDGYIQFKADMYDSYLEALEAYNLYGQEYKLSIDRIDNNKGYSKDNCRWVTNKEQSNNRRTNRVISYYGKDYTATELYEKFILSNSNMDLSYSEFLNRLDSNWNLYDAMNIPNLNLVGVSSIDDYHMKFGPTIFHPIRFTDDEGNTLHF